MIKISERKCPICGTSEGEVLHKQHFVLPEGHPLSDGYDVVSCVKCGFVYADTTATQDDFECFYTKFSKYEDHLTATGGGYAVGFKTSSKHCETNCYHNFTWG